MNIVTGPSQTLVPKELKGLVGVHHCSIEFKGKANPIPKPEPRKSLSVITVQEEQYVEQSEESQDNCLEEDLANLERQLSVEMINYTPESPKEVVLGKGSVLEQEFSTTLHSSFVMETMEDFNMRPQRKRPYRNPAMFKSCASPLRLRMLKELQ
jgi:hypothetical protein